MAIDSTLRKFHRIIAVLFLAAIPFATYASFRGGKPAALVYLPLFPLLGLSVTGTCLLVRPWVQRLRGGPR
jgi:hypothetical protein